MEQLGIEPTLLLAQIINFGLIAFVLSKLLYKPILSVLDKRKKEIEDGLARADKLRQDEESLEQRKEKFLIAARRDAKLVVEKAKAEAGEQEKQILSLAHAQAEEILAKAKAEALSEHERLEKQIRNEAVDLAVEMTKRLTKTILTDKDQHRLIVQHLEDLS